MNTDTLNYKELCVNEHRYKELSATTKQKQSRVVSASRTAKSDGSSYRRRQLRTAVVTLRCDQQPV